MGENCRSVGSSALRWRRKRRRRKRRRRSVQEFLISFRESFSRLAAPYRSAKISTYCRDTPSCFSWEVVYVLLVVEFSVITLTHCLSKLLEALRYYVLLFLGSVRFVVEELWVITLTHCLSKLLEALRYSLTFHRKLCTFYLLWSSRSSHRHIVWRSFRRIEIRPVFSWEVVYVLWSSRSSHRHIVWRSC